MHKKISAIAYPEVFISFIEEKKITLEFIYSHFNWEQNYFIRDNRVYKMVEFATSHSWSEEKEVRSATDTDHCVAKIVDLISQIKSI